MRDKEFGTLSTLASVMEKSKMCVKSGSAGNDFGLTQGLASECR